MSTALGAPKSARKLGSGETCCFAALRYQLTCTLPRVAPCGLPAAVSRAAALAAWLCSLHQTFDSFAPAHLALRAAPGSLPSGCPRRLGVFPSLRCAIALVFHVPLHCAWHRWARSGCNAGRGATEAGLSILKEFRPRCSLDDDPALISRLQKWLSVAVQPS